MLLGLTAANYIKQLLSRTGEERIVFNPIFLKSIEAPLSKIPH